MDDATKHRIETVLRFLNEKQRRLYLAAEVQSLGYGALKAVHELTGVAKSTISLGQKELLTADNFDVDRIRAKGGGHRKLPVEKSKALKVEIEKIMEKTISDGDGGESIISWTTLSLRGIAGLLCERGLLVSHDMVGTLLVEMGYSLRQGRKMLHFRGARPDRDTQFRHISKKCAEFIEAGQPVISIVSDEKELIEDFRNIVVQHCDKVEQERSDFVFPADITKETASFGDVYEASEFLGFVNLGLLPGMVDFGVEGILRWWKVLGCHVFGGATRICVVSDGGGRGGVWYKLWKKQLQVLADVSGLEVHVLYLPPGTSKWRTIRHELFCFTNESILLADGVSSVIMRGAIKLLSNSNWKGVDAGDVVGDGSVFGLELTVTDEELALLNLVEDELYETWNYIIRPKQV
ncbi:MAG: ISAzo13 family transposase [Nitrososphaerota archaeon]|jgi:transposase|nr:ISAzo13 family transposase [Nitrososphaerota archaeon]